MLLCCSQRTDLCAFYSEWLVRRFQDGLVDIRNPFAPKQVLRVEFSPSQVDAVIFMTKNPTRCWIRWLSSAITRSVSRSQ